MTATRRFDRLSLLMRQPAPTGESGDGSTLLIVALTLAVTMLALMQSLVLPSLPLIAHQLGASTAATSWVLTANLLAAAVFTPVLGRLGDTMGERRVILLILVIVSVGTGLSLATSTLPLLILSRVLQGTAYALFPLSMSVLRHELSLTRWGLAMGIVSSALAGGGVIGLLLAGVIERNGGDYHDPFWIGLGGCLLTLVLAARAIPHRPPAAAGRVDWAGAALLGGGLVLFLLPISQASSWGWTSVATLGCLAGAVVVLIAWVQLQRRLDHPLVRPGLLVDRRMVGPNIAAAATGMSVFLSFLLLIEFAETRPELAGYGFGDSVLQAVTFYLVPGCVAGFLLAPVAGWMVNRAGASVPLLISAVLALMGYLLLVFLRSTPWPVVVAGILTQAAITMGSASIPALLVRGMRADETGVANAINAIARSVGQACGTTAAVAILSAGVNPRTGFPHSSAFTAVALVGVGTSLAVIAVGVVGIIDRAKARAALPALVEESVADPDLDDPDLIAALT